MSRVAAAKRKRVTEHLERGISRDELALAQLTAAIEKKKTSLQAAVSCPPLSDLPNTHPIMRGAGAGDDKIVLGDQSASKRPKLAPLASRSNAAKRRARKKFAAGQRVTTAHSSTLAKPATAVGATASVVPEAPAPPSRSPFQRMIDLCFEDISDNDSLPDIGSDGEPKRRVMEYWEHSPPAVRRSSHPPASPTPSACLSASPPPSPIPAAANAAVSMPPSPIPAAADATGEDELALSVCSEDLFSELESASSPPRQIRGYDPERWNSPVVQLTRAERLARFFTTPSPKR